MGQVKAKDTAPLEIYVHIPFCARKCAYCDFLSYPAKEEDQETYVRALLKEIRALSVRERQVSSVFIGGGTPSLLKAEWIAEILDNLKENYSFSPDAEVSIEANPGTLSQEKLCCYKAHGVTRLSLGLQSTAEEELRLLGRIHTWQDFWESYDLARKEGFSNINVDLMFALPEQTYESWIKSLRTVAGLEPEHISAYSLIVEEGTLFSKRKLSLPDEETEYRMYEDTAAVLEEYGYHQYEISNYAKKGYACRHNLGYWKRYDYLGMGLGAASLYKGTRFSNTNDMEEYLTYSAESDRIRKEKSPLTRREEMEEFMILGLRMTGGISEEEFLRQFGDNLETVYGKVLNKYKDMGFLEKEGCMWRFSRKGIHVSNQILADFLE